MAELTEQLPLQEQIDALRDDMKRILDGMADFENRISYQENAHTSSDASLRDPQEDEPLGVAVIDYATLEDIDKVRALFVNLKNQFNERSSKKKRLSRYD